MASAFEGLRILDLSRGLAGNFAAGYLADAGAEVIKIEPPGGDPTRRYVGSRVWNRGKKSVVLDLESIAGRSAFLALARNADVLLETFRPGTAARLGIDYESLRETCPRLVYAAITGYGSSGPSRDRAPYDALVQARLGLQFDQPPYRRDAEGRFIDGLPVFLYVPLPSYGAMLLAVSGIATALFERERSGRGQRVDTSLAQGALVWCSQIRYRIENEPPNFATVPYEARGTVFACADTHVHVMPLRDSNQIVFEKLNVAPEGRDEPGPRPPIDVRNRRRPYVEAAFRRHRYAELVEILDPPRVPFVRVQSAADAYSTPQLLHNGMVAEIVDPAAGRLRMLGVPYAMEKTPPRIRGPQPILGADTIEVLATADRPRHVSTSATATTPRDSPLSGIRVLDFGSNLAGPFAPQMMADLGADVIKVEELTVNDRMMGRGSSFFGCQRGKRSLSIDLKSPEGREIIHGLMARMDVIHHNNRVGVAERLGYDYETAKRLSPAIVFCHTTGWGTNGPNAEWPGWDQFGQALGGAEWHGGGMDHGNPPMWHRTGLCDAVNAMNSLFAVLQALYHRERTGEGQKVETCIINGGMVIQSDFHFVDGRPVVRPALDREQTGIGPLHRLYRTADGWMQIACLREDEWRRLADAIGRPEVGTDARFADRASRDAHADALVAVLQPILASRPSADWQQRFDAARVPAEASRPGYSPGMFDDPEAVAAGWAVSYPMPGFGKLEQVGRLLDFSATPCRIERAPPLLGQHSREILGELGYVSSRIDELAARGVIRIA